MAIRSSSNTCISCCNLSHFVAFALSALSALSRSSWSAQLEAKSQKWPRLTDPWMFKKHAKKRPKIYRRISVKTHRNPSNFRLRIHPKNPSKPIKIPVSWYDQAFGALSCCWIWHIWVWFQITYQITWLAGTSLTNGILMRNQLQIMGFYIAMFDCRREP